MFVTDREPALGAGKLDFPGARTALNGLKARGHCVLRRGPAHGTPAVTTP